MSSIARWSYTEVAEVRPVLSFDTVSQEPVFGESYRIKCAWQDKAETKVNPDTGEEFTTQRVYSTEDARPRHGDQIRPVSTLIDGEDFQRIRLKEKFPMSMFGKSEKPDFGLVT